MEFDAPLPIAINGRKGKGIVCKPHGKQAFQPAANYENDENDENHENHEGPTTLHD